MSVLISDAIDVFECIIREWVVAGFSNMVSSAESDEVLLEVPAVDFGELLRDML